MLQKATAASELATKTRSECLSASDHLHKQAKLAFPRHMMCLICKWSHMMCPKICAGGVYPDCGSSVAVTVVNRSLERCWLVIAGGCSLVPVPFEAPAAVTFKHQARRAKFQHIWGLRVERIVRLLSLTALHPNGTTTFVWRVQACLAAFDPSPSGLPLPRKMDARVTQGYTRSATCYGTMVCLGCCLCSRGSACVGLAASPPAGMERLDCLEGIKY